MYDLRRNPWTITGVALLILLVTNGLTATAISVFDESLLEEFGWSRGELKFRDFLNFGVVALCAPLGGLLLDRFGAKRLLIVGCLVLSGAYFAYSRLTSLTQMYLIHVAFALALPASGTMVVIVLVSSWFVARRGLAIGIALVGTSAGSFLLPPLNAWLIAELGWRRTFALEALFPLAILVIVLVLVRNSPTELGGQAVGVASGGPDPRATGLEFRQALRTRTFWAIGLSGFLIYYSILAIFSHAFLHMRGLGYPPPVAASVLSLLSLVAMASKLGSGCLADRLDRPRHVGSEHPILRFEESEHQADQERLTTMLANDGYLYAQVDPKPILYAERYRADLHVWVNQGPLCRFGSASVSGQVKTDSALILKQLAFHRGDLYSQEILQRSQRFIYQLGVFQFVSIKVRTNASHDHILPVDIAVKEAPRLTTKLGVGYGREEFLRFFVDVRLLNVAGGARRINFYAKHSALEPYNLQLKLTQPAFIHPGASLSLSPFYRSEKEPGFSINRYGTDFSYQQRISYYTDGSISYTFERDGLSVSQITLEEALKNKNIKLYNKSSFTIGLVNDHSYPIFQPQRGWFNAFTTTFTGVGLNSDFHFLRWIFESRKYSKLMEGYVVAARIKIGSMKPLYQDPVTPLEERFYAGGSNSVRGWGRSRLGPLNAENVPIGGNSLLEASVEVRYPVYKLLSGVVFYDMGNVWKEYFTFPVQELRYASGGGLRFQTPIGPIRLDVAWPLGEGKRPLQLHISIGQAF